MTILTRLAQWKERDVISSEQHTLLAALARREPFSVSLELNVLLYAGMLAFVAGLGWTVSTWSRQLGALLVISILSALFAACLWYCFARAVAWAPAETPSPNSVFDYVLYLGCLVWLVELTYLEQRFHLLSGQWDDYLLATAALFFFLAYRFDNRFVLSLALSSLAGWFGLALSHWQFHQNAAYRQYGMIYSFLTGCAGVALKYRELKPHFLGTYLNVAANVLFWALLSGVFNRESYSVWLALLLAACAASLFWGLTQRQFAFVAYAALYGYIGISAILAREISDFTVLVTYFLVTSIAMVILLVVIARRFGREA